MAANKINFKRDFNEKFCHLIQHISLLSKPFWYIPFWLMEENASFVQNQLSASSRLKVTTVRILTEYEHFICSTV